ncbi:MAG: carbohydrate kinase family protein [Candidatus Taylorbacteria bacterium]|nr:carbohydrate kinase family protein [Candidatus Taylorbacteria bacterium]
MFSKQIDFLAIGDIVTDAFIKLKDAHVTDCIDHRARELCVKFADKIPFESVDVIAAVGNSANAAVSASRLGLSSALVSDLGNDIYGKECLDSLKRDKVGSKYVTAHKGMPTNYHYVLWYDSERTILVKHQDYPRKLPRFPEPKWIYLSSLGGNSEGYHAEIAGYLEKHPGVKLAFQPGTFQMSLGVEKLKAIYARADVFFCNKEEAQRILKTEESDPKRLMEMVRGLGPKIVVVTDGPNGAYAYDGADAFFMPVYPDPKPAYERTGAGDAFASTFTVALALGKSLDEALRWAPINSASVVQDVGAQRGLLSKEKLAEWLAKAPADYKPKKI